MGTGCCSAGGETLLFACAGAAHSGQVANRAALELTREGLGQLYCLAAVAAGVEEKLERTRRAARRVAIDGCEDHCARRALELAEVPAHVHVDLANLGIEKKPARPDFLGDTRKAGSCVRQHLADA